MCELCPDLLSCQPTHCGGYAIGRRNVAEILAGASWRSEQDRSTVQSPLTTRVREAAADTRTPPSAPN